MAKRLTSIVLAILFILQFVLVSESVSANDDFSYAKKVPNVPRVLWDSDRPDPYVPKEGMKLLAYGSQHYLAVTTKVQERSYWCGPASVQQLLAYKGYNYSQVYLAKMLNTQSDGTYNTMIPTVLNQIIFGYKAFYEPKPYEAGYRLGYISNSDMNGADVLNFLRRVKTNTGDDYPMIYNVKISVLYPHLGNGHYVTGNGWKEGNNGSVSHLYFVDPWGVIQDPTYAGLKIVPLAELIKAIRYSPSQSYVW